MATILDYPVDILDDRALDRVAGVIRSELRRNTHQALSELCVRAWNDFNRIPWASAFLRVFDGLDVTECHEITESLKRIATAGKGSERNGAVLLLLGVGERFPEVRLFLQQILPNAEDPFVLYLVEGYLLSHGTAPQPQGNLVREQAQAYDAQQHRDTWKKLLRGWRDNLTIVRDLIRGLSVGPGWSDLRKGFFQVYDHGDTELRASLEELLLRLLRDGDPPEQAFVLDFFLDHDLRRSLTGHFLNQPVHLVWRLANSPSTPPDLRNQASWLLEEMMAPAAPSQLFAAARGDLSSLSDRDRLTLSDLYVTAIRKARKLPSDDVVDLGIKPGWTWKEYAHAVWRLAPAIPVDVEGIAQRLGILVMSADFESGTMDGCLIRAGELPLPLIVLNLARRNPDRRRFTLAHELAHAVLPEHDEPDYVCEVFEGTEATTHERPAEAEADRFAATLLMPPQEIAKDARRMEFRFEDLDRLRAKYQVSFTALVFSLVPVANAPVAAFLTRRGSIIAGTRSDHLHQWARGRGRLHPDSLAAHLLDQSVGESSGEVDASVWFEVEDAPHLRAYESSRMVGPDDIVSVVELIEEEE